MKRISMLVTVLVTAALFLTACSGASGLGKASSVLAQTQPTQSPTAAPAAPVTGSVPSTSASGALAAFDSVLEQVYQKVNPSVVNIQVAETVSNSSNSPFGFFSSPDFGFGQGQNQGPQVQQGLGSGFVWDKQGHIVTNNHVVDGADKITVTFSDGYTLPGKVIGHDPNSDLAVVQVDVDASRLQPVSLADSSSVNVGQLAIAIGNPYGLSGSMTMGIISALGRSISSDNTAAGSSYSIPDVIQTDAPINPGNSGGVLLNENGQVIGVTAAIESASGANAGVGFAIPASIVQKVVPSLIEKGDYLYSWLGISGTSLTFDLNQAMKLNTDQRGALIIEVTSGGPADKAGLRGSSQQVTINGQDVQVGGDIITAIDGQPVKTFDELVSYLVSKTQPGQKVTLSILRGGKEQTVEVTLAARPDAVPQQNAQSSQSTPQTALGNVYLGVTGLSLSPEINQAMNLDQNQQGVLVEEVQANSPADDAGLRASSQSATVNGQRIQVGGDVITAVEGSAVSSVDELRRALSQYEPGQQVSLTILRNGRQRTVTVTLAARPVQ